MDSIIQYRARQRIASVLDVGHGVNGTERGVRAHIKAIEKAAGLTSEKGDARDFMTDYFGKKG